MIMYNVDLSPVPNNHMASLASSVTWAVLIKNVGSCDLIRILNNLECNRLCINRQSLSTEETGALVQAMESRVEEVSLSGWEEVSLDISVLTQYNGEGRCREVVCYDAAADRYWDELSTWSSKINWRWETNGIVGVDLDSYVHIHKSCTDECWHEVECVS